MSARPSGFALLGSNYFPGNITVAGQALFANGTAAAPSISFASTPDMGFYRFSSTITAFSSSTAVSLLFGPSGTIYGTDGQSTLVGGAGGWSITNSGGNKSITLTPSGTGFNILNGGAAIGTNTLSSALLAIGTNTTTSAGGMVFGTDCFLYRSGALELSTGVTATYWRGGGTTIGTTAGALNIGTYGSYSLVLQTNGTTALTLDSSQNATFAGRIIQTNAVTPTSAAATGTVGTMAWDTSYIYICTATNTWKRVAIATW